MKALRLLTVGILMAGICLSSRAVYLHLKAGLASILIHRAWEQSVRTGQPRAPWPRADTHPIARLHIPRLGYDEIVLQGATPRTLAFGPGHIPSGADLGGRGNLLLAGHRTSWFRPLEKIAPGDEIRVEWFAGRPGEMRERKYVVLMIRVVNPQDVTLLAPTPGDALTLITCYPFGRSPRSRQRYVVRASPVGPSHLAFAQVRRLEAARAATAKLEIEDEDGDVVFLRAAGVVAGKISDAVKEQIDETRGRNLAMHL